MPSVTAYMAAALYYEPLVHQSLKSTINPRIDALDIRLDMAQQDKHRGLIFYPKASVYLRIAYIKVVEAVLQIVQLRRLRVGNPDLSEYLDPVDTNLTFDVQGTIEKSSKVNDLDVLHCSLLRSI